MKIKARMSSEITVRISLDFQDSPEIHTLLAMTPVRERRALICMALERYIKETDHPAGDVEHQILQMSEWLRGRQSTASSEATVRNTSAISNTRNQTIKKEHLSANLESSSESLPPKIDTLSPFNEEQTLVSAARWLSG